MGLCGVGINFLHAKQVYEVFEWSFWVQFILIIYISIITDMSFQVYFSSPCSP